MRYDPLGRLYEIAGNTGTTRLLMDGDALSAEYDAAGTLLRRYVHGADIAADDPIAWYEGAAFSASNERHLRSDWQGSIVLTAEASNGSVIAVNRYDEYGIPQAGNVGRFGYTGQAYVTELGMYYYKARMYSATLGRFMQTDPIGYKDQINLYAYVGNDPVNKVDPTGLAAYDGCSSNPSCSVVYSSAMPMMLHDSSRQPGRGTYPSLNGSPSPPVDLPYGPYEEKPNAPGNRASSYQGPPRPQGQGPRSQAQFVPPATENGPPGSKGYWKVKPPGQEGARMPWQRYDKLGRPLTPGEAHPNPKLPPPSVGEKLLKMFFKFPIFIFPGQLEQIRCMREVCPA